MATNNRRRRGSGDRRDEAAAPPAPARSRPSPLLALLLALCVIMILLAGLNRRLVQSVHLEVSEANEIAPRRAGGKLEQWVRGLAGYKEPAHARLVKANAYQRPDTLELQGAQLEAMNAKNRSETLARVRAGELLINPAPTRLHGLLGLEDDGSKSWQPTPLEVPYDQLDMVKELRVGGGFNLKYSDALPLDRDVRDNRDPACRSDWKIETLPRASVVIIFYNEPRSTLFRSIHSILNYTPPELLEEIVLVDDGSDLEWIVNDLNAVVDKYPKLRLHRMGTRSGIVGARMAGIRLARSPIFVVLDSHIEAQPGWLEPLVARISEDRTVILMPQVDSIDPENFGYSDGGIGCTLGFLWKMIEHSFTPTKKSPADRRNSDPNDAVSSPTMAGGLFAADKDFFLNELGGYDEGFQFWGTENLELSFRTWQCGGRLECMACSRIYHIFRKGGVGYSSPPNSTTANKIRLLSVWMDQYADLAYKVLGEPSGFDYGDVSSVQIWRSEHQCKSFQWFLENVYPESAVLDLARDVPYLGRLKVDDFCLHDTDPDSPDLGELKLIPCTSATNSYSDFVYFARPRQIQPLRNDEACINTETPEKTKWCEHGESPQWDVEVLKRGPTSDEIRIMLPKRSACLAADGERVSVVLKKCDRKDKTQIWTWQKYSTPSLWTPPPRHQ